MKSLQTNPVEAEMLAEANKVYHKIWQVSYTLWILDTRTQTTKLQRLHSGEADEIRDHLHPDTTTPGYLNTTVANQAYTFNGTTLNANVSYTPGTFNMGAPFPTYQQVLFNQQQNQTYTQNQQYQEVGRKIEESKKKMSQTEGCVNKDDAECYQENFNDTFNQLKNGLLQDNHLHTLIEKFTSEICKSMWPIKLQPEIGLAQIQDIVNTAADKEGTALKSFLKGELVLSKEVWQQLIDLKFRVTVNWGEKIMKQLEEGIYMRNTKSPEEKNYLRNKIAYIFKDRSKAHKYNAKADEGLAELAQKMDSLSDFYMFTQATTADGIVINSQLIDRMLTEQKNNKSRQDELLQEHLTSKAVEEMCLPMMKEEWIEKSFKPTQQLAAAVVYFYEKESLERSKYGVNSGWIQTEKAAIIQVSYWEEV